MRAIWTYWIVRASLGRAVAGSVFACGMAQAASFSAPTLVSSADVMVALRAGEHSPRIESIDGPQGNTWSNLTEDTLPAKAEMGGATIPISWQLKSELGNTDGNHSRTVFVYESAKPHLRLRWQWEARANSGPVEHRITIENLSGQEIWLPLIDSLRMVLACSAARNLQHLYVEKGADTPSAVGTHLVDMVQDYRWTGKSSTYAFPEPGEAREIIPAEVVFDADGPGAGWFAGIEFSGRTRISLERRANAVKTVLGLDPEPGPFRTRLEPGGTFETPTAFLGLFSGGPDGAGNQLRTWVTSVLGNPVTRKDPRYPLLVNNSWGSGMQVDEKLALRMISESKELGLEMFHLDAGWFRGVGDWYPDPKKFPHGLAFVADQAHKQGLRFGIWVDWTQAALDTEPGALNVHDPKVRDWMITDLPANWKPDEFKGQTLDLGVPAAHKYLSKEVDRIVTDYHLDMLEHDGYLVAQGCTRDDHPHAPPNRSTMKIIHDWSSDFVIASNSTDVSYHAVRAYYDIYEQLRRNHPGLLFEICNDGGRMVDFGSAAHGDYFSITDTYDPLSNRRAFYDTSFLLPPAMLESYVEKWPVPRLENFLYMLRSGMMGWLTIMTDTTAWTAEQHEAARKAINLYKSKLRPLIRDAQLYHISQRPDGVHWDAMEYWDPNRRSGVVFAFRGSDPTEAEHTFILRGLDPEHRYSLHFEDGTAPNAVFSGTDLMTVGLRVRLDRQLSSELVFIEEFRRAGDER